MVREEEREGKEVYVCEQCGFAYKDRAWAEKCERYCTEHNACSFEITSHAIEE